MHTAVWRITTKSRHWYETDYHGCVLRCDNGLDKREAGLRDLNGWRIIGLVPIDNFGHIGRMVFLDELDGVELVYKNGKPRYTVVDVDHGTRRIHGNHAYHGVVSVQKLQ